MCQNEVHHPVFARVFARVRPGMDEGGVADHRRRLLAGLAGRVVEIGAGDGANFPHYSESITSVLAVEPEPYLLRRAQSRADLTPIPIKVIDGVAERIPAADTSFDAAVVALVLCTVGDQRAALRELYRVIRPGGQLRFFEHVRADTPRLRRVQQLLDGTVWPTLMGGCHTGRDTAAAIEEAGFHIDLLERIRFPEFRMPFPSSPHLLGAATRP